METDKFVCPICKNDPMYLTPKGRHCECHEDSDCRCYDPEG